MGGKLQETQSCRTVSVLRKSERNQANHRVKDACPGERAAAQAGETCSTQNLRNVKITKTGPRRFLHERPGWDARAAAHSPFLMVRPQETALVPGATPASLAVSPQVFVEIGVDILLVTWLVLFLIISLNDHLFLLFLNYKQTITTHITKCGSSLYSAKCISALSWPKVTYSELWVPLSPSLDWLSIWWPGAIQF